MSRPKLLDLYCGAGGAGMGYHRAGFDVVGVDVEHQKNYPFEFHQADALSILRSMLDYPSFSGEMWRPGYFAAVHASPPCQDHIRGGMRGNHGTGWLLGATRGLLEQLAVPWVIENVPGAPMRVDYRLCGCMFGLPGLRRPRWFETSWRGFDMIPPCHHTGRAVTVAGHGAQGSWEYIDGAAPTQDDRRAAMGIGWMNRGELAQAIPPAFTEYIGAQLLEHLTAAEGAA